MIKSETSSKKSKLKNKKIKVFQTKKITSTESVPIQKCFNKTIEKTHPDQMIIHTTFSALTKTNTMIKTLM